MLSRYKIYRGARPANEPKPDGVCQDARYRCTRHPLHPPEKLVKQFFDSPAKNAWNEFRSAYLEELEKRFSADRAPFDELADLAGNKDVYLGCNCPTQKNPRVDHCHTFVALEFMKKKYPTLIVSIPEVARDSSR